MTARVHAVFMIGCCFVLLFPLAARSQDGSGIDRPQQIGSHAPRLALAAAKDRARLRVRERVKERARPRPKDIVRRVPPLPAAAPLSATDSSPKMHELVAAVTLADIGFGNGLHFANLGGHRELYVPLPQEGGLSVSDLVLVLDDFAAHAAKRNLIVQVNDRTVAAIALDGQSRDRTVQIPLGGVQPKDGYLKLSFLYSGAATPDRCVDVRYVGDSVTVKAETAVELDIAAARGLDVAGTAKLMPRDVALVLPGRHLAESEMAAAITIARALIASGRQVAFYDGYDTVAELAQRGQTDRWSRGIVLLGRLADVASVIDAPVATLAGDVSGFGTIAAVRIHGLPALAIADDARSRAARLFGTPLLAATRGVAAASVGRVSALDPPADRVTFDQLGVPPQAVDVFGRAELDAIIDTRRLPAGTRPRRLALDVMVAPDGAGTRAVVSAFVNERLLGSTVAANGEVDTSRSAAAHRAGRHDCQSACRRRARHRAGRLSLRAAGISGANSRLLRAGTWQCRNGCARFFRSHAAFRERHPHCCAGGGCGSAHACAGLARASRGAIFARDRAHRRFLHRRRRASDRTRNSFHRRE